MGKPASLNLTAAAALLRITERQILELVDRGVLVPVPGYVPNRFGVGDLLGYITRRDAARAELAESFATVDEDRRELTAELAGLDVGTARRVGF